MAAQDGGSFRFITVNDDEDELVVHAGSGKAPAPAVSDSPAESIPEQPVEDAPAADPQSARQEQLRRRAEEIAQAEEGLEDPHTFSRMRTIVLLALAALVIAFVVYLITITH
ncbi:MAG: hypothetical protein Q4C36_08060 [Coriobacteriia bacterium]|nr:hypothetical protein [Coriobacteriia bacterium]